MSTARAFGALALVFLAFSASACATFDLDVPTQMAPVQPTRYRASGEGEYALRAMTPKGVVLAVRVIPQEDKRGVPKASHEFWVEAIRQRMRTSGGYALLGEESVADLHGHKGTRLMFGRDQRGATYLYWLTVFVTDENIHLVEAGGRKEPFEEARVIVEQALASYEVKR